MKNCFCVRLAVFVHRFGQYVDVRHSGRIKKLFGKISRCLYHLLRHLTIIFCKIMFAEDAALGTNIWFSGKGNIIVGVDSIGGGCVIHHNVTFGMHLAGINTLQGKPTIGKNVWVGPDTIIHGDIVVGEGVTILAGSVLTKSTPPRCVVAGNPARIIHKKFDNTPLRSSSGVVVNKELFEA